MRRRGQVIGALTCSGQVVRRSSSRSARRPGPGGRGTHRTSGQERNLRRSETIAVALQGSPEQPDHYRGRPRAAVRPSPLHGLRRFTMLRDHARESNQRHTDTARNLWNSATG